MTKCKGMLDQRGRDCQIEVVELGLQWHLSLPVMREKHSARFLSLECVSGGLFGDLDWAEIFTGSRGHKQARILFTFCAFCDLRPFLHICREVLCIVLWIKLLT